MMYITEEYSKNILTKCIGFRSTPLICIYLPTCNFLYTHAFVPGRLISDNVLVAFETIHSIRKRKSVKNSNFSLKLDMSKADDRVEWNILEQIMTKMGFNTGWVDPIMRCVRSVSYWVLVNGKLSDPIKPS